MKKIIDFWGQPIEISVDFDTYKGETIFTEQKEALEKFIKNTNLISQSTGAVLHYIDENYYIDDIREQDILKVINPTILFIKRTRNKRTVAVLCDSKTDIEHGIALLFEDEKFISIVNQENVI